MTDREIQEQNAKAAELAARARDHNDADAIAELTFMFTGYTYSICKSFIDADVIEMDEVPSLTFLAVCDAIKYFDGTGSFVGLLRMRLMGEITEIIATSGAVTLNRNLALKLRKFRRYRHDIFVELGREPANRIIASRMGATVREVAALRKLDVMLRPLSIDAPVGTADGEISLADTIPSPVNVAETAEDALYHEELRQALQTMLDALPEREKTVISCRFYRGMTLDQTAALTGTSREGARAAEGRAMRKLRRDSGRLEDFLQERDLYAGTGFYSWQSSGISAPEMAIIKFEERQERTQKG